MECITLFSTFSVYLKCFTIKRSSFPSPTNRNRQFPKATVIPDSQEMERERDDRGGRGG